MSETAFALRHVCPPCLQEDVHDWEDLHCTVCQCPLTCAIDSTDPFFEEKRFHSCGDHAIGERCDDCGLRFCEDHIGMNEDRESLCSFCHGERR